MNAEGGIRSNHPHIDPSGPIRAVFGSLTEKTMRKAVEGGMPRNGSGTGREGPAFRAPACAEI